MRLRPCSTQATFCSGQFCSGQRYLGQFCSGQCYFGHLSLDSGQHFSGQLSRPIGYLGHFLHASDPGTLHRATQPQSPLPRPPPRGRDRNWPIPFLAMLIWPIWAKPNVGQIQCWPMLFFFLANPFLANINFGWFWRGQFGPPKGDGPRKVGPRWLGDPQFRPGFHTTVREPKRAHLRVPTLQTPPKFHGKTQREKKNEIGAGEGKKAKCWAVRRRVARGGSKPTTTPTTTTTATTQAEGGSWWPASRFSWIHAAP